MMKLTSLMAAPAKELGLRFHLIGTLPSSVLFAVVLALMAGGAPKEAPNVQVMADELARLSGREASAIVLGLLIFNMALLPLQLRFVQFLEGYWGTGRLATCLKAPFCKLQKRRRKGLEELRVVPAEEDSPARRERMAQASWRLRQLYPPGDDLMPTALGNALRAGEHRPTAFYGLDAVVAWPRLYPLLSDEFKFLLGDIRNQLDMSVRLCLSFGLLGFVSAWLLLGHGWWLFVPAGSFIMARISYNGAIAAAVAWSDAVQAAFDLHRFDLLKALHLPLPVDLDAERKLNRGLSDFLRDGGELDAGYMHEDSSDSSAS